MSRADVRHAAFMVGDRDERRALAAEILRDLEADTFGDDASRASAARELLTGELTRDGAEWMKAHLTERGML